MDENGSVCVFCEKSLDEGNTQTLTQKGVNTIHAVCSRLKLEAMSVEVGQSVHFTCRKNFIDEKNVQRRKKMMEDSEAAKYSPKKTRSICHFDFKNNCFFCGNPASLDDATIATHLVLTPPSDFDSRIKSICRERADQWATTVMGRIGSVNDLRAADAIYHHVCKLYFTRKSQLPSKVLSDVRNDKDISKRRKGRPLDARMIEAFAVTIEHCEKLCDENEFCTLAELQEKMSSELGKNKPPYSLKSIKNKLLSHFKSSIVICTAMGLENVVFLKTRAEDILRHFYEEKKKKNSEEESERIISTASKLIKSECRAVPSTAEFYPTLSEIASVDSCKTSLPKLLLKFLTILAPAEKDKVKIAAIGQAIVQMVRPKGLILPLQLTLGVQLHHLYASRNLIQILNRCGFCCSYTEVIRYEANAAAINQDHLDQLKSGHFTQFVADNVDHNLRTIDGLNTFHGMGIIGITTPVLETSKLIPRETVPSDKLRELGKIQISFYKSSDIKIKTKFENLAPFEAIDKFKNLDLLWKMAWLLNPKACNWSGLMQQTTSEAYPGKSCVFFLPIIDLNPSDYSCIYSTLLFVESEAKKFSVQPVLTFDQPLFWKASLIIDSEPEDSCLKSIVLRLGGFHTIMSYLGCIGHFMKSSGIEEFLEQIYGENTVHHILSGHDVSRALRAFLLLDAALNFITIIRSFEIQFNDGMLNAGFSLESDDQKFKDLSALSAGLLSKSVTTEEACDEDFWSSKKEKLETFKSSLESNSQNAKLWFQFMEMMDILRSFLRAERTGNWALHLKALRAMLPYFAAAGHNLYCKSARLYLQKMKHLPETSPATYQKFLTGFHVGRRSDRYWAGLSTDLIIEQVLMRNLKSIGGLTHGSGFAENKRVTWLLSMPVRADVNAAMKSLLNLDETKFEYHKDCTTACQTRDLKDMKTLVQSIQVTTLFQPEDPLKNLNTGKLAESSVNAFKAFECGEKILSCMNGTLLGEYSFKKFDQVLTMNNKDQLKVADEVVHIDHRLLFQRLLCILNTFPSAEDLQSYFDYELCTYPMALFDKSGMLRKPKKSDLAATIAKKLGSDDCTETLINFNGKFILDGGHLLHQIPWPRQSTYAELAHLYVQYVLKHYGKTTIIFDNYSGETTTKDLTHLSRSKGRIGPKIDFTETMNLPVTKQVFLSNEENKQKFLEFLGENLRKVACETITARADADLLIVTEALKRAEGNNITIVGKDTDLLILAIFHFNLRIHKNLYINNDDVSKKRSSTVWNVRKIKEKLEPAICDLMLFSHAFLGCDTTSHLHSIHKGTIFTLLMEDSSARNDAAIFNESRSSKAELAAAGERILVRLYKGGANDTLNTLRLKTFHRKISSSTSFVQPEALPPTRDAAKFHCFRVFHQVMQWMGVDLDAELWGWEKKNGILMPKTTENPPAPETLLNVIRCSCKEDGCSNQRCSCKKYGIACTFACKHCQGTSCHNSQPSQPEYDQELDADIEFF